jgi:hypothetical protein
MTQKDFINKWQHFIKNYHHSQIRPFKLLRVAHDSEVRKSTVLLLIIGDWKVAAWMTSNDKSFIPN